MAFKRRHKIYSLTLNYKGTPLQFKVRAVHTSSVHCEFYWEGPEPESRIYNFASGRVTRVKDRDAMIFCLQYNLDKIWHRRVDYIKKLLSGTIVEKPMLPQFEWRYPQTTEPIHTNHRIWSASYNQQKMYDAMFEWAALNVRTFELADISVDYGI
jgi:hypothetical protein